MIAVIGVYGASGCGRGIMPLLRKQYQKEKLVFVDDAEGLYQVNGCDVVSWSTFKNYKDKAICIAISDPHTRHKLSEKCVSAGVHLVDARCSTVIEMDSVLMGPGACLSPFVTLTSNIRIGQGFHANIYSHVEHDCVIGDFVTLATGVRVNGNVTIGDKAYLGSGAIIRQGLSIGAGSVVGMGAVVTRDVPPVTTVVGNPAKQLIKE